MRLGPIPLVPALSAKLTPPLQQKQQQQQQQQQHTQECFFTGVPLRHSKGSDSLQEAARPRPVPTQLARPSPSLP